MTAHVLHGDSFLVPTRLREVEAENEAEGLLDANRHRLTGSQVKPEELFSICTALPFMDARRLVIVEGLLAHHEGTRGRGRQSNTAASIGGWQELATIIPAMPETTLLVFLDGPLSNNNALLRLLEPICNVEALTAPSGEALARWIKSAAESKGGSVSPAAIACLRDLVGSDLWTLNQELEKLSLYATGRAIEEADVRQMVPQVREANIFAAVDAMIEGRPNVALKLLNQLRQDGREAPYIIGMVERQLRMLSLARESMDQGLSQKDTAGRLGITSQFVIRKTMDQARRHSWADIRWRYTRLLEADLAIKQGRLEPDLALEILVADQSMRRPS